MEILAYFFILIGVLSFLISAIGLLRMPELYTRMHIGTKATTMGTFFVVLGAIVLQPSWSAELILLTIFIFMTNPLSSSVIARAAHTDGARLEVDDLDKDIR